MDDDDFRFTLRMSRHVFFHLVHDLTPSLEKHGIRNSGSSRAITPVIAVAAALHYWGNCTFVVTRVPPLLICAPGCSLAETGFAIGLKRSTAFKCVRSTMQALFLFMENEFNDPYRSIDRINAAEKEFREKYGIPWVIGVIDGCHIPIQRTYKGDKDTYYNRKGFMSVVLSAVVDSKGNFLNIDVGEAGARHDAWIYKTSALGVSMQE